MKVLEQLLQKAKDSMFTTNNYEVDISLLEVIKEIEKQINKLKNE